MKFFKWVMLCFCCLLLVSCGEEAAKNLEGRNPASGREEFQKYEMIKKPEYALSKNMKQMYIIRGQEQPYFIFRMNTSEGDQYISCKLANENKWFTEKAEWSDYIAKRHKDAISLIVSDSRGVIYILCSNKQKTKYSLYQQMPNRKLQKLNIDDIYIRQKEKKLLSFNLINENRLVFFFSQERTDVQGNAVEYDIAREKFIEKDGYINDISASFDKDGNYYSVSPGQKLIMKKSLYSEIPEGVIKCDAVTEECQNNLLIVQDDFGYILTRDGIFGGKIEAEKWEVIIPEEQLYFCNEFPTPILGIANMEKVAGGDREFYLMTWKNAEFSDFEWIHYVTE